MIFASHKRRLHDIARRSRRDRRVRPARRASGKCIGHNDSIPINPEADVLWLARIH